MSRQLGTIGTHPGGQNGAEWTSAAAGTLRELCKTFGGQLTNVAGTNAITASVPFSPSDFDGYTNGLTFTFFAPATNTGAMSIAIQGLTAIPLWKSSREPLSAGDIAAGQFVACVIGNGVAYVITPLAETTALTAGGGVKRTWKITGESNWRNSSHTFFTLSGVQGAVGDVLELPVFSEERFTANTNGIAGVPLGQRLNGKANFFYEKTFGAERTVALQILRDSAVLKTVVTINFDSNDAIASKTFDATGAHLITLNDTSPHDYSVRVDISGNGCDAQMFVAGTARLLSAPTAVTVAV